MSEERPLKIKFYVNEKSGKEPVREWLKGLDVEEKKAIGGHLKAAQYGWPLGLPRVRKMESGLWEVRSELKDKIGRIFLTKLGSELILLHGFIKKTQKTPEKELNIARRRLKGERGIS